MYEDRALYVCASDGNQCERRKGTPLRIVQIKVTFRCFITIWSIGIARRGLDELTFVKIYNSLACSSKFDGVHLH